MADGPDLGIDAQAIEALGYNADDVGLSLTLADTLFDLLGSALTSIDTQAAQIADLTARLAALETPAP